MSALVRAVMPDPTDIEVLHARELRYADIGRLAAVETPAGFFYGFMRNVSFWSGPPTHRVHLKFRHAGAESDTWVEPDHPVHLHTDLREEES